MNLPCGFYLIRVLAGIHHSEQIDAVSAAAAPKGHRASKKGHRSFTDSGTVYTLRSVGGLWLLQVFQRFLAGF